MGPVVLSDFCSPFTFARSVTECHRFKGNKEYSSDSSKIRSKMTKRRQYEGRSGRKREILTSQMAFEIFLLASSKKSKDGDHLSSFRVSKQYGVSPKTIRDIWNR
jgi:hypothetical protein